MKKINLISNFSPRGYQQSIFANSLNKNSLVVLPTGLGKTVIAIMLTIYYFNQSNKKVLFLAPTKPLVEQQKKSFMSFFSNANDFNFQVLTGTVAPKKRAQLYQNSDFIFSTPQLIENDIINEVINLKDFCFVVFDEAHRATGNYAYTFIAEEISKTSAKILALTASPGTGLDEIRQIILDLRVEHVEVKKYEDNDVKPHVKETKIDYIEVELPEIFLKILEKLNLVFKKRLEILKNLGFLQGKNINQITKRDLLDLSSELRVDISKGEATDEVWSAISISAGLMKLQYGIELFESQEISATYNYFYNFFRDGGDKSKAAEELALDINFRDSFDMISKLNKEKVKHPKLIKLKEIVFEQLNKNKDLRLIIFNQYRDSASKIVEELSTIKEIKPVLFIGQSKKTEAGLSQKEQKRIIENFRDGEYNVLVSTSVGEEGLDIPKVDLVIFYEPVPSAIRTIQRTGRTGRFSKGQVIVLISGKTKDVITRHVASAKEKKMYKVLDQIKKEFGGEIKEKKQEGLGKFLKKENDEKTQDCNLETENQSIKIDGVDERILIYLDLRENSDLIKELFRKESLKVEAKKLEVADIVISQNIAIERKAKIDFVNSIIDKRLFAQLIELAKNYRRPLLIIEGSENIFSLRSLNPNVIRATLSAISIDLRIPIIFTDSLSETAAMIETIAKRTVRDKKEISLVAQKSGFSENEELEKFVSSIPKVNVVSAKSILKHFKTIKQLVNADENKLLECEGIGKIRAKSLVEFFKREYK